MKDHTVVQKSELNLPLYQLSPNGVLHLKSYLASIISSTDHCKIANMFLYPATGLWTEIACKFVNKRHFFNIIHHVFDLLTVFASDVYTVHVYM